MNRLKTCPFCGSKATLIVQQDYDLGGGDYFCARAECDNTIGCGASMMQWSIDRGVAKEAVIGAWNRRVSE